MLTSAARWRSTHVPQAASVRSGTSFQAPGGVVRRSSSGPSLGGNGARRARVSLVHPDAATARRTIARCLAEVRRLEGIFSLYLADSAVSRLNRAGVLRAPPFELLEVLDAARTLTRLSHGAFDVRVQPLWAAHASRRWDELEPAVAALTGDITATATQIRSERPDMALTFNGIAQGYITDRETGLLADDGFAFWSASMSACTISMSAVGSNERLPTGA